MARSDRFSFCRTGTLSPDKLSKSIVDFGLQVKGRPGIDRPVQVRAMRSDRWSCIKISVASIIQTKGLAGTENRYPVFPVNGHPAFAVYPPAVSVTQGQGTGFFIDSQKYATRQRFL